MKTQTPVNGGQFVFREVRTPEDLLEVLRLRYSVYRGSRLSRWCDENDDRIDVDCWDKHSRHFSLHIQEDGRSQLIGCLRVVEESQCKAKDLLAVAGQVSYRVRSEFLNPPPKPLPLLHDWPADDNLEAMYQSWMDQGERVVLVSRLCLSRDGRSLTAAKALAQSIAAVGFFGSWQVARALFSCHASHAAFYRRLGFAPVSGTKRRYWDMMQAEAFVLDASPDTIPRRCRTYLHDIANEFESRASIHFNNRGQIVQQSCVQEVAA